MNLLNINMSYFLDLNGQIESNVLPRINYLTRGNIIHGWAKLYNANAYSLFKVSINKCALETIKAVIQKQCGRIPIMIADMQTNIARFIDRYCYAENLHITSISRYSGCCEHLNIKEPNTLNWLKRLTDDPGVSFTWIANDDSEEYYWNGKNIVSLQIPEGSSIIRSLDETKDQTYDAIFLCKNSVCLPPHLESYFLDLAYELMNSGTVAIPNTQLDKDVLSESFVIQPVKTPILKVS